jgi:branched-chain amino acid transport system substrate-binding protein
MRFPRTSFAVRILAGIVAITIGLAAAFTHAQEKKPIRIGLSIAQTGPLSGAGKSGLLGLQLWRDDVNARGGLLGRPVELIVYDDQSSAATVPGIYAKLLDVDKVDLLIGPYSSNLTAPIMPLIKQRDLLLIGNFALDANARLRHDKYFSALPSASADQWAAPFFDLAKQLQGKTIAMLAADAEFAQTLAGGARNELKKRGLQLVYDQTYPPNTVDFSSMLRAIRAKQPDAVFVAGYPSDSTAIIRAVKEIGIGDSVKLFGGGMVGLQNAAVMQSLGSMLNGVVNYHTWVPEKSLDFPGVNSFLTRYQARAKDANVDALGFYLPPFSYASGQMLEQAVSATKSLEHKILAKYLHDNELKTIVGGIRFNALGEWAQSRLIYVQFRGVADKNLDQFRAAGKQVIVAPAAHKTGDLMPFGEARK